MDWPLDAATFGKLPILPVTFYCIKRSKKYEKQKPYFFSGSLPPDEEMHRSNLEYESCPNVLLRDIRGYEDHLDIDRHGFQFIDRRLLSFMDCNTEEHVQEYMLGISEFAKSRFAAELVVCYDYNVCHYIHLSNKSNMMMLIVPVSTKFLGVSGTRGPAGPCSDGKRFITAGKASKNAPHRSVSKASLTSGSFC